MAGKEVVGKGTKELFFQPACVWRWRLVLGGIDGDVLPAVLCARAFAGLAAVLVSALGADGVDGAGARLWLALLGRLGRHGVGCCGMRVLRKRMRRRERGVKGVEVAMKRVLMGNHGSQMEWA